MLLLENNRKYKKAQRYKIRNQLASEPNYHKKTYFSENLIAIEMKQTKIKMNKSIYLGMTTVDIRKTLTYEFWYDISYQDKVKLCHIDTDSFIIHVKNEDFYKDIAHDIKNGFTNLTIIRMINDYF